MGGVFLDLIRAGKECYKPFALKAYQSGKPANGQYQAVASTKKRQSLHSVSDTTLLNVSCGDIFTLGVGNGYLSCWALGARSRYDRRLEGTPGEGNGVCSDGSFALVFPLHFKCEGVISYLWRSLITKGLPTSVPQWPFLQKHRLPPVPRYPY